MNTPCAVIRDLLPLYAEDLASEESKALVDEHLESCPNCRRALEELKAPPASVPEPDGAEALRAVKKTIRRRRLRTALLAALLVFLPLFALLARSTDKVALPYDEDLIHAELTEDGRLSVSFSGAVSGVQTEDVTEPDSSEHILLLQAWTNRLNDTLGASRQRVGSTASFSVDDCTHVIYGFGSEQHLLYGEPMNGGVQVLPRLALSAYLLLALAAAAVFGLLWLCLRKKKAAPVLRALFFAALSYPAGHLLVKGAQTTSFFLARDLACILLAAAAVWGLLMLLFPIRASECGMRNAEFGVRNSEFGIRS